MGGTRVFVLIAVALGFLAIVMVGVGALGLVDIAQGSEPNLRLEWTVVWSALGVALLALIVSLSAIYRLMHGQRGGGKTP